MPYNMAVCKPYEQLVRHFSWRVTVKDMTDAPFQDIADRIRWHRSLEGMTQAEYARAAGFKRSQLSNWESGQQRISIDAARTLRRIYGLSLDFIYEGIDDALPMTLRQQLRVSPEVSESR